MSVINRVQGPPGPMGWGDQFKTPRQNLDTEKRVVEKLVAEMPAEFTFGIKPAKSVDLAKMEQLQAAQQSDGIEDGVSLMHIPDVLFGAKLAWLRQLIGSCVASGDMRTTSYRMLAEIFFHNQPEQLPGVDIEGRDAFAPFAPYSYRAGRKIGGLNRGDGSFCSAHIKGKMQYGHLMCSTDGLQSDAFPEPQSQSLYRKWGNSNQLLEQYASAGRTIPLTESVEATGADQVKDLIIEHLKPFNICSSWAFVADYKHPTWKLADGSPVYIYKKRGTWAHNMSVVAFVLVNGRWYVIIENSWGNYHKNGKWFAIPAELFDTWLRSAECMSVGEIDLTDNAPMWPMQRSKKKR